MSKKWIAFTLLTLCPVLGQAEEKAEAKLEVKEEAVKNAPTVDVDKVSETLGHLIVRHLDNPGFKFNIEKIVQGIKDEREGLAAPMSEEEYELMIGQIQESIFTQMAEKNLESANAFLEKNAKEDGVVAINPKLQYKVLAAGEGTAIEKECIPLVHYTGKLLDGTVFSSSKESGKPITLPIKQTIAGFSDGLVGMKKGEKRVLYIHPELAYGVSGHLPPNSLLIFEVEIVETDTKVAEAPAPTATPAEVTPVAAPTDAVVTPETVQKVEAAAEQKPAESADAKPAEAPKSKEVTVRESKKKQKAKR